MLVKIKKIVKKRTVFLYQTPKSLDEFLNDKF